MVYYRSYTFNSEVKNCVKLVFLISSHLLNFDAEANIVKNFYSSDLLQSDEFDQESQPWKRYCLFNISTEDFNLE